ncbi:hypothetical protein HK098_003898 [Nowakowskiella sp. JEL0407]|nr:hypothetical protein HK098_003898 [Nowakowskiella sp. JEL0407]
MNTSQFLNRLFAVLTKDDPTQKREDVPLEPDSNLKRVKVEPASEPFEDKNRDDKTKEDSRKRLRGEPSTSSRNGEGYHNGSRSGQPIDSEQGIKRHRGEDGDARQGQYPDNNSRGRGDYGRRGGRGRGGGYGMERRPLCRDYEEKGYCMKGPECPYDHGRDKIVVDDLSLQGNSYAVPNGVFVADSKILSGMSSMGMGNMRQVYGNGNAQEPYDPERASFMANRNGDPDIPEGVVLTTGMPLMNAESFAMQNQNQFAGGAGFYNDSRGGRGGGIRGRGRGRGRGEPGRFPNANIPIGNRTNTTLVVENIPAENCTMDKVLEYFRKFGNISNIQISTTLSKALLQFATNAEAHAAHTSPEPIFGNRFVKVYWYKPETDPTPLKEPLKEEVPAPIPTPAQPIQLPTTFSIDHKREAEKERKKRQLELQKKQQELIAKLMSEQKELREMYEKKRATMTPDQKNTLKTKLEQTTLFLNKVIKDAMEATAKITAAAATAAPVYTQKSAEELERLRLDRELDMLQSGGTEPELQAQLDALKEEASAQNLGINPNDYANSSAVQGAYRGRGRGWPGRGRGAWAGSAPQRTFKLDNRTTKILVRELGEISQESVQVHFEKFGEVDNVSARADGSFIVQFKSRTSAEKVFFPNALTDIVSMAQVSWYDPKSTPSQSVPGTSQSTSEDEPKAKQPDAFEGMIAIEERRWSDEEEEEDFLYREKSWKR